ncbi:MAG: FkbM family methyltransferase [Treponema sp.]|nr:FkbM family methyltransferase [Treponema sp.]
MKLLSQIHQWIQHNTICITLSKIIQWDKMKSFVQGFFSWLYMKKNHFIFRSSKMSSIIYLPYYRIDDIQSTIFKTNNYYEFNTLDYICNRWENGKIGKELNNAIFIDIGANIGNHSLYFFNECHAASSYCFEPVKDTFKILEKNISLNNLTNKAHLYNIALGQKKGRASLSYYNSYNIGMAKLSNDSEGEYQVVSLDELKINANIKFIKIDVEGFELDVIQGMVQTLERYSPYIMIEIRHNLFNDIDSLLKKLGYKRFEINQNEELQNCLYYPAN